MHLPPISWQLQYLPLNFENVLCSSQRKTLASCYERCIVFFKHQMPENMSNLLHSHCSTGTDSRWCIFHCASWEAPDSSSPRRKQRERLCLVVRQPGARLCAPRVEMPLPETGMVPSLWRCKGQELARKVAGDGWQRRANLAGLASGMGMEQRSRERFGLGKVLIPFSFHGVDV